MSLKFVIAGTFEEYWAYREQFPIEERVVFQYVVSPHTVTTEMNPSGVFIGTWKDREDIMGIFANLNNMTLDKLKLARLQEIWRLVVKHKEKQ